jgi:hypothetical protein
MCCQLIGLHSDGDKWMNEYRTLVEWYWQEHLKYTKKNLSKLPLCPPQIQHGLAWDQTWSSMVKGLWLTAESSYYALKFHNNQ